MPGKTPEDVERAIDHQLDLLKSEPISEKELQKAKNQVEAAIVFRQDSIFGQAMRIGRYEISGGWSRMDRYLTGIRGLAATDIVRAARKYLNADQRTVGTLIPIQASQP